MFSKLSAEPITAKTNVLLHDHLSCNLAKSLLQLAKFYFELGKKSFYFDQIFGKIKIKISEGAKVLLGVKKDIKGFFDKKNSGKIRSLNHPVPYFTFSF